MGLKLEQNKKENQITFWRGIWF